MDVPKFDLLYYIIRLPVLFRNERPSSIVGVGSRKEDRKLSYVVIAFPTTPSP